MNGLRLRRTGPPQPENSADAVRTRPIWQAKAGYLFHPIFDFLLVGGGSIICLVLFQLFIGNRGIVGPKVLAFTVTLSIFVNYPHFAHSYQILYAGFARRVLDPATDRLTRLRYVWAGLVVPVLLAAFFVYAAQQADSRMMSLVWNGMFFFVGWHYVKQGYGMLIVLSALRKIYFSALEKRLLLANTYVIWLCAWLNYNATYKEDRTWGLLATTFDMPDGLVMLGRFVAAATTAMFIFVMVRRSVVLKKPTSFNGLVGYCSAVYLWLLATRLDPVFLYVIPAFHSLQYLLFVWRFQINKAQASAARRSWRRRLGLGTQLQGLAAFAAFILLGEALGWFGFLGLPHSLDLTIAYDRSVWGSGLYIFMFAMFINIHHYFIDNVIWRKENDEVRQHLFAT